MLIRNATAYIGGRFQSDAELRVMHGAVQEIGHGLVKGLYESELDLQGDYLLPGFMAVGEVEDSRAVAREAYRLGVAVLVVDCETPALRGERRAARIVQYPQEALAQLPSLAEVRKFLQCRECPSLDRLTRLIPGAPVPLTRWRVDWRFVGILDAHAAD